MKIKKLNDLKHQRGIATLFTAVILLIATTLVTFLTARTVLMETKMSANNYRASQAIAAADAGMDYALAYFNGTGLTVAGSDHDGDGSLDHFPLAINGTGDASVDADGDGVQDFTRPNRATIVFYSESSVAAVNPAPLPCVNPSIDGTGNQKSALIQVTGTSDDGTANRTIYQCVGTRNLLQGDGPKQTLVSGSVVDLTGSAQIINRYSDLNIWSADTVDISGSSMETYIRPSDTEVSDLTEAELIDTTTSPSILNVQKVSSGGLGGGTDIYQNDTRLVAAKAISALDIAAGNKGDGDGSFFNLFFLDDKSGMQEVAANSDQSFPSTASPDITPDSSELDGLSGVIYIDGDASLTGGGVTMGTEASPAIIIVDGDFSFTGGTITGILYVRGEVSMAGGATVVGTMLAEGGVDMGAGTSTLVYARNIGDGPDGQPINGTTGIISGSWRDW